MKINQFPMSIETRMALIDLLGNIEMLLDEMIQQEVLRPNESVQLIRQDNKKLRLDLCEPFKKASEQDGCAD